MEGPGGGVILGHTEPWDERNGALVDGEQHLAVQVHPRHLRAGRADGQVGMTR